MKVLGLRLSYKAYFEAFRPVSHLPVSSNHWTRSVIGLRVLLSEFTISGQTEELTNPSCLSTLLINDKLPPALALGQSDSDTLPRSLTALHAASQPAALYAACAINNNAINSTNLGNGQPASQPTDPSPLRLFAYMQVFRSKMSFLVTTTTNPVDVLHMVCTRLRAKFRKFRHRTTRRFRGDRPQTK